MKILRTQLWRGKRYERFRAEIDAMRRCSDVAGVLPVLDANCPDSPEDHNPPWFVMGLAVPIRNALGQKASLTDVIGACANIADTLAILHERGFSHRDVKPDNLFRFDNYFALGDFGLVDYPGKRDITGDGVLGPVYYVAPEMLNDASVSDGRRADVFSLAKTIWVLATGQNYPLPGVLDSTSPVMTLSAYVHDSNAKLLNRVLERATQLDPAARLSMRSLAEELRGWLQPISSSARDLDVDLSEFAQTVASMNERHVIQERARLDAQRRVESDGTRLREMLRPTAQRVVDALAAAHFLNPRLNIDNHFWGFVIAGHVMAETGPEEVELRLAASIQIPDSDSTADIAVDCAYSAEFNEGRGKVSEVVLWFDRVSFSPGGSVEQQAMRRLIDGITTNLAGSVRRVVEMAAGTTRT